MKIPDGTATVCVEVLHVVKAGHWRNLRRLCGTVDARVRRTAQIFIPNNLQVRIFGVFLLWENGRSILIGCCFFLCKKKGNRHNTLHIKLTIRFERHSPGRGKRYPVRIRNDRSFLCLDSAISQKSYRMSEFYHALFGRV